MGSNVYKHNLSYREGDIYDPVEVLKRERDSLVEMFGTKDLAEVVEKKEKKEQVTLSDIMRDIMRYNRLTKMIEIAEIPEEEKALKLKTDRDRELWADINEQGKVTRLIRDIYQKPDKCRSFDMAKEMRPEVKQALEGVRNKLKEIRETTLKAMRAKDAEGNGAISNKVLEQFGPKITQKGLPELAELVNKAVKEKTYEKKQGNEEKKLDRNAIK